jgi:hypothetical protein
MRASKGPAAPQEPLFSVRWLSGTLLGIRVGDVRTAADWSDFSHQVHQAARESPTRIAVCSDLRTLQVLPDEFHGLCVAGMREVNPHILRSAILVPDTSLGLKLGRLLRDAGSDARQVCRHSADVKAWLSSCLNAQERIALDDFLGAPNAW